jgi:hypothetical protein
MVIAGGTWAELPAWSFFVIGIPCLLAGVVWVVNFRGTGRSTFIALTKRHPLLGGSFWWQRESVPADDAWWTRDSVRVIWGTVNLVAGLIFIGFGIEHLS